MSAVDAWCPRYRPTYRKPTEQLGMPTKSQSCELRSMALHHFAISLCDTQVDATRTPTTTWRTHSLLSLADTLQQTFQFSHLRNQDEQSVLCNFVIFIIIRGFFIDTEKNSMDRRNDDMRESRNVVKFLSRVSGHDRCCRALRPIRLCEAPAGLSLFSQQVRTDALYEHSGVHAASYKQFLFSVLGLPHHDL